MEMFDFEDGNGPVPAHRHPDGDGWVADTADVAATAFIGPNAQVFGNALVCDGAWVSDDARVSGGARVSGDARVCNKMRIMTTTDYFCVGPVGSRNDILTVGRGEAGILYAATGCFAGTLEEFEAAVEKTHGDNAHGEDYRDAVALARRKLERGKEAAQCLSPIKSGE